MAEIKLQARIKLDRALRGKNLLQFRNWFFAPVDTDGAFYIPLLLITSIMVIGGFGILGLMRHWRFLAETQLRLNQCVGQVALDFKDTLNTIHLSNQRIEEIRAAIVAAHLEPSLIPPLRVALEAQVVQQDAQRIHWKIKSFSWMKNQGCGAKGDIASPLPVLQFERAPPDTIGPQALYWIPEIPSFFLIQVGNRPRWAAAMVKGSFDVSDNPWSAVWTIPAPQTSIWPSID
jgi:hypothetical protein